MIGNENLIHENYLYDILLLTGLEIEMFNKITEGVFDRVALRDSDCCLGIFEFENILTLKSYILPVHLKSSDNQTS